MGQYNISECHKAQEKIRKNCQGQAKVRKSTKHGVVGRKREPPHASSIFLLSLQIARGQKVQRALRTAMLATQAININRICNRDWFSARLFVMVIGPSGVQFRE